MADMAFDGWLMGDVRLAISFTKTCGSRSLHKLVDKIDRGPGPDRLGRVWACKRVVIPGMDNRRQCPGFKWACHNPQPGILTTRVQEARVFRPLVGPRNTAKDTHTKPVLWRHGREGLFPLPAQGID